MTLKALNLRQITFQLIALTKSPQGSSMVRIRSSVQTTLIADTPPDFADVHGLWYIHLHPSTSLDVCEFLHCFVTDAHQQHMVVIGFAFETRVLLLSSEVCSYLQYVLLENPIRARSLMTFPSRADCFWISQLSFPLLLRLFCCRYVSSFRFSDCKGADYAKGRCLRRSSGH
jgi:hypothetical protein